MVTVSTISWHNKPFNSRCTTCGEIVSRNVTYLSKSIEWTCSDCKDPTNLILVSSVFPCPHCDAKNTTVGACDYCADCTHRQLLGKCKLDDLKGKVQLIAMARSNARDVQNAQRKIQLISKNHPTLEIHAPSNPTPKPKLSQLPTIKEDG